MGGDTWCEFACPVCKERGLYNNGDTNDLTAEDVMVVKCWNCETILRVPETVDEGFTVSDDQDELLVDTSIPIPVIPKGKPKRKRVK